MFFNNLVLLAVIAFTNAHSIPQVRSSKIVPDEFNPMIALERRHDLAASRIGSVSKTDTFYKKKMEMAEKKLLLSEQVELKKQGKNIQKTPEVESLMVVEDFAANLNITSGVVVHSTTNRISQEHCLDKFTSATVYPIGLCMTISANGSYVYNVDDNGLIYEYHFNDGNCEDIVMGGIVAGLFDCDANGEALTFYEGEPALYTGLNYNEHEYFYVKQYYENDCLEESFSGWYFVHYNKECNYPETVGAGGLYADFPHVQLHTDFLCQSTHLINETDIEQVTCNHGWFFTTNVLSDIAPTPAPTSSPDNTMSAFQKAARSGRLAGAIIGAILGAVIMFLLGYFFGIKGEEPSYDATLAKETELVSA